MRYETDINGYITCIFWGCNSGKCKEYTGAIPTGYTSLAEWEANAVINAYYIDSNGNLVHDAEREEELNLLAAQQAVDNAPVLRKEIYGQQEALESQYLKASATGKILELTDAKNMAPAIKITGITPGTVRVFAQTKNMLRNDMVEKTISGVTFEKQDNGKFIVEGYSSADIEYTLAGSSVNTEPLFALVANTDYYFAGTHLTCEFRCFNGETTEQVYLGKEGIINLPETKEVTHVVAKIPAKYGLANHIAPTLYLGSAAGDWADSKCMLSTIDLLDQTITDTANATLSISGGLAILQADGKNTIIGSGNVNLLNGYNMVYTNQGSSIEIEYCKNILDVESLEFLQGKSTTTNKFKVLPDGSIMAHNGYFSGELNSEAGTIGGWHIEGYSLCCDIVPPKDFTQADVDKISNFLIGAGTLTDEEKELYDINRDGVISAADRLFVQRFMKHGLTKSKPGKLVLDTSDWFFPIKIVNSEGVNISWFGPGGTGTIAD